jgi:hypothetical protein
MRIYYFKNLITLPGQFIFTLELHSRDTRTHQNVPQT